LSRPTLDIAQIARDNYDAVYRFCARRVGSDRAADVAQETFLTAQKALPKYRQESSVRTWLFGIAHNECRRIVRQKRLETPLLELDPAKRSQEDSEETLVNRQALQTALAKLSDEHREVVLLHEVEGLTYEEVGVVLGVPAGTVKSRLHHAFLNLRKALEPVGGGR
jgi:RNA polymerase sigma-70 factor (ECF subfamily)